MSTNGNGHPHFVRAEVLQEILDVSSKTVDRLCQEGEIPYLDIGPRLRRFDVDEVVGALHKKQKEAVS